MMRIRRIGGFVIVEDLFEPFVWMVSETALIQTTEERTVARSLVHPTLLYSHTITTFVLYCCRLVQYRVVESNRRSSWRFSCKMLRVSLHLPASILGISERPCGEQWCLITSWPYLPVDLVVFSCFQSHVACSSIRASICHGAVYIVIFKITYRSQNVRRGTSSALDHRRTFSNILPSLHRSSHSSYTRSKHGRARLDWLRGTTRVSALSNKIWQWIASNHARAHSQANSHHRSSRSRGR